MHLNISQKTDQDTLIEQSKLKYCNKTVNHAKLAIGLAIHNYKDFWAKLVPILAIKVWSHLSSKSNSVLYFP